VNAHDASMIEVELKFRVRDLNALSMQVMSMGAIEGPREEHEDLYFRHPCRDFVKTREALRIRRVRVTHGAMATNLPSVLETRVTYKGPHLPGGIKARHELEWDLQPSDPNGDNLQELLVFLGFRPVSTVKKIRRSLILQREQRDVTIALDDVQDVGTYVEVEVIASGREDVESARGIVEQLAKDLQLVERESRSYLTLLVGKR
jgi:adenylate cyclase, class 2